MNSLENAWNMYVFRDAKETHSGQRLLAKLMAGLRSGSSDLIGLLLRAGELECALTDANAPHSLANVTDKLAAALVCGSKLDCASLIGMLSKIAVPDEIRVAPPEGFAYYFLHPLDFADLVHKFSARGDHIAVIGIRSIGTTLSAIVRAALCAQGKRAQRITVRPMGHPYQRAVEFDNDQAAWVSGLRERDADFLIADEGPGISGSSFLSVASALTAAGVDRDRITFLCTRHPNPATLTAPDAATRWPLYHALRTSPGPHIPEGAKQDLSGGSWRTRVFASEREWPSSWTSMERPKFLSADGEVFYRFEGFGRFGEAVRDRACVVAQAGFGVEPRGHDQGFGVYPMLRGRSLCARDAGPDVLRSIAKYCAFRVAAFQVVARQDAELETMVRHNLRQEFGAELPKDFCLECESTVVCDGRMLPHKWIETADGILKVDNATHGDDHFFPGPCDIAWDLAGTIVEWDLSAEQQDFFVAEYCSMSRTRALRNLSHFLLAYSAFRMAYCKMAAASMRGADEEARLMRDFTKYRSTAAVLLGQVREGSIAVA